MKRSFQHPTSSNWLSPNWLRRLFRNDHDATRKSRRSTRRASGLETLESRSLMAADTLPVLLVVADQQDFYYQEYGDTRLSLEEAGVEVRVAATTTNRSVPHPNTGEPAGTDGGITPDIALSQVNPDDYSAIAFVGGWGSSMYQYAFSGDYQNDAYDGDLATKETVNKLIDQFLSADKHVAAICHGVTVLAWARVDGASPLAGKTVSVPYIGSPPVFYQNTYYTYYQLGQYEQIVDNGGTANTASGQYGDPNTVADDVVVDGRIITGENYDSAREFGRVIAREVFAATGHEDPPAESLPPVMRNGDDIIAQGTNGNDIVYAWSGSQAEQVYVWINGTTFGPYHVGPGGHVRVFGGSGDDQIFATDLRMAVEIRGEGGHDLITGGSADDLLDGGDGFDRVYGMAGDDMLLGGAGDDCLVGMDGNDVIVGDDGNDYLEGSDGRDILIGGLGGDYQRAGGGDDILIGGTTSFDDDVASLDALRRAWLARGTFAERADRLLASASDGVRLAWGETVFDDDSTDRLCTGDDDDLLFASAVDAIWTDAGDRVVSPV